MLIRYPLQQIPKEGSLTPWVTVLSSQNKQRDEVMLPYLLARLVYKLVTLFLSELVEIVFLANELVFLRRFLSLDRHCPAVRCVFVSVVTYREIGIYPSQIISQQN